MGSNVITHSEGQGQTECRQMHICTMTKKYYVRALCLLLVVSLIFMCGSDIVRLHNVYMNQKMNFRPVPKSTTTATRTVINITIFNDTGILNKSEALMSALNIGVYNPAVVSNWKPLFTKAPNIDIFIFSAVFVKYATISYRDKTYFQYAYNTGQSNVSDYVVMNGWEDKLIKHIDFKCCIKTTDGRLLSFISSIKRNWGYLGMAKYQAKQHVCPLPVPTSQVELVTITSPNVTCHHDRQYYIKPYVPSSSTDKDIAVCAKIAFGALDPGKLLEWLEAHRYLGVSKVFIYTNKLNVKAMEILKAYQSHGFVEMTEFALPMETLHPRKVGEKNMQSWNDEQVVVFDCQERAGSYKYVTVVDADEYLITEYDTDRHAWKRFFDKRWSQNVNLAALRFDSKIHITDWGPSANKSSLFIGQYLNCTASFSDRAKNVYKPERIVPGSVQTHGVTGLPGYQSPFVMDKHIALHHYRSCRFEWRNGRSFLHRLQDKKYLRKYESNDLLNDFQRYTSDAMLKVANAIEVTVNALKVKFKLKT